MTRIAILDYGMGNLRSVEKALERVGAEASITADPWSCVPRTASSCPASEPSRAAMRRVRELELDALVAERLHAPAARARHLPRPSAPARALDRAGRGGGPRPDRRRGHRARRARPEGAPHRLGAGSLGDAARSSPRAWPRRRRFTSCTRSGFVLPTRATCSAPPSGASASSAQSPSTALRGAVPPGEVERRRPAPAGELRADLRLRAGLILYPAIDIRGGHAVRLERGDYGRETVYDADPADAAAAGSSRVRASCTSWTSTGRGRASPRTSST